MKGITIYLDLVKQTAKRLSDEELGRFFRATLEAAETETIPTFEDEKDDILFDGFRTCLEQGLKCVNGKRTGGKNSSDKRNRKNGTISQEIEICDDGEIDENKRQLLLGFLSGRRIMKTSVEKTLEMNEALKKYVTENKINISTITDALNEHWENQ